MMSALTPPPSPLPGGDVFGNKFPVMDNGKAWVELLDMMPHPSLRSPDQHVVAAARVSYASESKGGAADKKLLFYLFKNQHTSPFEQVKFQFRLRAPLVTYWQWSRHRTWSFVSMNLQSGRYTSFEENEFYVPEPDAWRMQSKDNKQGSNAATLNVAEQSEIVKDLLARMGTNNKGADLHPYRHLENGDLSELLSWYCATGYTFYESALASGVAKELARLFIPAFGVYYTSVVSVDAHNLMHFLRLRRDAHAQYEIRAYADVIYEKIFKVVMPQTAEAFDRFEIIVKDRTE